MIRLEICLFVAIVLISSAKTDLDEAFKKYVEDSLDSITNYVNDYKRKRAAAEKIKISRRNSRRAPNESHFPFLVSISRDGKHCCSGTIITSQFVLSAGECFYKDGRRDPVDDPTYIHTIAVAGDQISLNNPSEINYKIKMILIHPMFDPNLLSYNIALLRIKDKIKIVPGSVAQVRIMVGNAPYPQKTDILSTGYNGQSGLMTYSKGQIARNKDCVMDNANLQEPHHICTMESFSSNPVTDNGGALVLRNSDPPILIGVVSKPASLSNSRYSTHSRISVEISNWIISRVYKHYV